MHVMVKIKFKITSMVENTDLMSQVVCSQKLMKLLNFSLIVTMLILILKIINGPLKLTKYY